MEKPYILRDENGKSKAYFSQRLTQWIMLNVPGHMEWKTFVGGKRANVFVIDDVGMKVVDKDTEIMLWEKDYISLEGDH
jgi:hypothetical protein